METATEAVVSVLFATSTTTCRAPAARVRLDLEREYPGGPPPGVDLAAVAPGAIAAFEGARVKTFLPVLALRAAREALAKAGG
ncbi:MAG TPA: hypothetical protein VH482_34135 [Thermomicrobiales bacterium]|jgi:hypothetical protein